jgi:serine/threonine protein kinase
MAVAVKKLKPRENMLRIAQAEVLCMLLTKSNPRTINILGACLEPLCIVVPYYENGSLFDLIHKKRSKLSYERVLQIARDVALGCQQLHSMRPPLMHRFVPHTRHTHSFWYSFHSVAET